MAVPFGIEGLSGFTWGTNATMNAFVGITLSLVGAIWLLQAGLKLRSGDPGFAGAGTGAMACIAFGEWRWLAALAEASGMDGSGPVALAFIAGPAGALWVAFKVFTPFLYSLTTGCSRFMAASQSVHSRVMPSTDKKSLMALRSRHASPGFATLLFLTGATTLVSVSMERQSSRAEMGRIIAEIIDPGAGHSGDAQHETGKRYAALMLAVLCACALVASALGGGGRPNGLTHNTSSAVAMTFQ